MYLPTHIVTYGTFQLMEVVTCVGQFFDFVITSGSGFLKNFKIKGKLLFQGESQTLDFLRAHQPRVHIPYTYPPVLSLCPFKFVCWKNNINMHIMWFVSKFICSLSYKDTVSLAWNKHSELVSSSCIIWSMSTLCNKVDTLQRSPRVRRRSPSSSCSIAEYHAWNYCP